VWTDHTPRYSDQQEGRIWRIGGDDLAELDVGDWRVDAGAQGIPQSKALPIEIEVLEAREGTWVRSILATLIACRLHTIEKQATASVGESRRIDQEVTVRFVGRTRSRFASRELQLVVVTLRFGDPVVAETAEVVRSDEVERFLEDSHESGRVKEFAVCLPVSV